MVALTIRERNSGSQGTLVAPLSLPLDLSRASPGPVRRRFTLGYEGQASTAVYRLDAPRRIALQVNRVSDDRYAVHVSVALLDATTHQRVAPLVERSDGIGAPLEIEAGAYLILASTSMPERVEVELEVLAAPIQRRLEGLGSGGGTIAGSLLRQGLVGAAVGRGDGSARHLSPLLAGAASGGATGVLTATAIEAISGRLAGEATSTSSASARLADFRWIDPRGRVMGPLISITPASWHRTPRRGLDDVLLLTLTDAGGGPLDLGGLTVIAEAWDSRRFIRYAIYTTTVLNQAGGRVELRLPAVEVDALPESSCWDLRVEEAGSGRVAYLFEGSLTPQLAYTR